MSESELIQDSVPVEPRRECTRCTALDRAFGFPCDICYEEMGGETEPDYDTVTPYSSDDEEETPEFVQQFYSNVTMIRNQLPVVRVSGEGAQQPDEEMTEEQWSNLFASFLTQVELRRQFLQASDEAVQVPTQWDYDPPIPVVTSEDLAQPHGQLLRDDDTQCSICLESDLEDKVLLECGHLFHQHCYTQWRLIHSTCPMCRAVTTVRLNAQGGETNIREIELGVEVGFDEHGAFHEALDDDHVYPVGTSIFYCIRTNPEDRLHQAIFPHIFRARLERDEENVHIYTGLIRIVECGMEYMRYPGNPWKEFLRFRITLEEPVLGEDLRIVAFACEDEQVRVVEIVDIPMERNEQQTATSFIVPSGPSAIHVSHPEYQLSLNDHRIVSTLAKPRHSVFTADLLSSETDNRALIQSSRKAEIFVTQMYVEQPRFLIVNYGTKGDVVLTQVLQRVLGDMVVSVVHKFATYANVMDIFSGATQLSDFEKDIAYAVCEYKPTAIISVTFVPVLARIAQTYQLPIIFCTGANMCLNGRRIGVNMVEKLVLLLNDKVMQYAHERNIITMAMVPEFLNVSNASLPTSAIGWIAPELQELNEQVRAFVSEEGRESRVFAYLRKVSNEERLLLERFAQVHHQKIFIADSGADTDYVMYQNELKVQYLALFQIVKIAVLHGGFNTVNEALMSGVRIMVFPMCTDQRQYSLAMNDHGFSIQFATNIKHVTTFFSSTDWLHPVKPVRVLRPADESQIRTRFLKHIDGVLPRVIWSQETAICGNLIYHCGVTYDIVRRMKSQGRVVEVMYRFEENAIDYINQPEVKKPGRVATRWPVGVINWTPYVYVDNKCACGSDNYHQQDYCYPALGRSEMKERVAEMRKYRRDFHPQTPYRKALLHLYPKTEFVLDVGELYRTPHGIIHNCTQYADIVLLGPRVWDPATVGRWILMAQLTEEQVLLWFADEDLEARRVLLSKYPRIFHVLESEKAVSIAPARYTRMKMWLCNGEELAQMRVRERLADTQIVEPPSCHRELLVAEVLAYIQQHQVRNLSKGTLKEFDERAQDLGFRDAAVMVQLFFPDDVFNECVIDTYLYILSLGKSLQREDVKAFVQDDLNFEAIVEQFQYQFPITFQPLLVDTSVAAPFVRLVSQLCTTSYLHFYGVNEKMERDLYPIRRTIGTCLVHMLHYDIPQELHYLVCSCHGGGFRYIDKNSLKIIRAIHRHETQYCAVILAQYVAHFC